MYNYFLNTIPPHTDDYLKFLLFPSNRKYDLSLKNKKKVLVTICADYGNMGDIAIAFVQMEFLQKLFPDRLIIPSLISNIYADMKSLKEIINDDDIITIIGGGNNGSLYPGIEFSRMFVISQFKKNKIISFPQTLVLEDTVIGRKVQKKMQQIYSSHPNLTLAAREEFTYQQYQVLFPNIAVLAPDIVLSYRPQLPDYERDGLLLCLRSDAEKKSTAQFTEKLGKALSANYEISFIDTTNNKVYKEINEAFGDMFTVLERISKAKVMITDRLHGMIFSYITGTPCIVLPCSGPKIEYSYRFIKNCEYIRFCPSFDIDSIIKELDSLPIDKQWKPDDLSESYQDFKKCILENTL